MPEPPDRVQTLFLTAVQVPYEQRAALLDLECGSDTELRHRVEALLGVHDEPGSFLDVPSSGAVVSPTVDQSPITEKPGTTIGRYKLLEQIGEGGFGVVYMAEQTEPVRRKVAVKIIKPGMDTKEVIARFEAERQALALMDHPNIASVLDAGATGSGRPYFVMELVRGVPITDYCDQNHLSARQRLELFDPVCRAVQHAHQKGIIHRDIKPTNVLVTMRDDTAVPKVIDFGVAKATNQRLTERTLFTGYAQMLGTPLYMSPEQAQMNELDVDTRSDIYSLGVLLYELLTGTTPFDRRRLREAAYDELLRIIREEEPHKPSTRISTLGDTATRVSAHRQTDPRSLSRILHGELDWIVMKALEKDRTRRYESANGLAADVRRYLADEAVTACPPSVVYRFRKFARRNKAVLGTLAMIGLVLVTASAFSTWQAIRATEAEQIAQANLEDANSAKDEADAQRRHADTARIEAENQRQRAEMARADAEQQRERAETEAHAAEQATQRESAERERAEANFSKAREAVDRYFTMVSETTLLDRPDLEDLRRELLDGALEYYEDFAEQRADDPQLQTELVAAHFRIAQLRSAMGRADWLESVRRGVQIAEQLADAKVDVSGNVTWRAGIVALRQGEQFSSKEVAALPVFQKAAKIWEVFVGRYPDVAGLRNDLAMMYLIVGVAHENPLAEYAAYKRAREILEGLVRDHPTEPGYRYRLAVLLHELAYGLKGIGSLEKAEQEWRRAIELFEDLVADFPGVPIYRNSLAESQHTLAGLLAKTGNAQEAQDLWAQSIAMRQALLAEFPNVYRYWNRLSASYRFLGRHLTEVGSIEGAADAFRSEIDALQKSLDGAADVPRERMQLFHAQRWLGFQLWSLGELDDAHRAYSDARDTIETLVTEFPDDHDRRSWQARHYADLARLLGDQGETAKPEELFDESSAILEDLVAEHPEVERYPRELEHTYYAISEYLIARYRANANEPDERIALNARIDEYVNDCRKRIKEHPKNPTFYNAIAWVVANTEGDLDEAVRLSQKSIQLARASGTWNSQGIASLLDTLAHCYFAQSDYVSAMKYQEEAAELNSESDAIREALVKFRAALSEQQRATK